LWGVSNKNAASGILYTTYSNIVGSSSATIQAGTYTLELQIGNGNVYDFTGLNDISSGSNTDLGAVAGFFSTVGASAEATKNNMYEEFNGIDGVTYSVSTPSSPVDGLTDAQAATNWTTWTFTWDVAEGSSVIGSNLYFGVYAKVSNSAAFFDDSTLSFTAAIPEPATIGMLGLGALITLLVRRYTKR
jgi:hypothetical protein